MIPATDPTKHWCHEHREHSHTHPGHYDGPEGTYEVPDDGIDWGYVVRRHFATVEDHRPIPGDDFMPPEWCGACETCRGMSSGTICAACSYDAEGRPDMAITWPCEYAGIFLDEKPAQARDRDHPATDPGAWLDEPRGDDL